MLNYTHRYFFQGIIIVQEVFPDGVAGKDGRLLPGDQLIEVNILTEYGTVCKMN